MLPADRASDHLRSDDFAEKMGTTITERPMDGSTIAPRNVPLSQSNRAAQDPAEHALRAIGALFESGDVIEIRALDVGRTSERPGATHAGYFNFENGDAIAAAIRSV